MKTSEIKQNSGEANHPIKLRFENIKEEIQNGFTVNDMVAVDALSEALQKSNREGNGMTEEELIGGLSVLKKVRKVIECATNAESSKIRFRIVKSSKKGNNEIKDEKEDPHAFTVLPSMDNKSEILSNKENRMENRSFMSVLGKAKLKKITEMRTEIEMGEVRSISNDEIISKLKTQLSKSNVSCEEKSKEIECLNAKVLLLENQLETIKKSSLSDKTYEPIKIDLKLSLKCIKDNLLQKENQKEHAENCKTKLELEHCLSLSKELQFIVVTQGIEIDRLLLKLAESGKRTKLDDGDNKRKV